ncbi:MAG: hypothetical protein A2X36_10010 [Elusimicrobia bacterium GWA2_69_24]|nr:MAG: hypothetical protein A2X36_10010 [Elusimicrobia bacterium GWA2_69_24]HBL17565.1 hypothetical protein [Elusimicrobiota bacterium]
MKPSRAKTLHPAWLDSLERGPLFLSVRAALRGTDAYLVGGALRDAALGRKGELRDLDLAAPGDAEAFARRLAKRLGGTCFLMHEATQVYRIVPKPGGKGSAPFQVDVARLQGQGILADLGRRDFAANAMALPCAGGDLLDPFGGLQDLERRVLRATHDQVFREDPLRLLRAFRIAAQLGLRLDAGTLRRIRKDAPLLKKCAGERKRMELFALLSVPAAAPWLHAMDDAGLLAALLPELEPSRACAEVYYGKGGVLKHSLAVAARMDLLLGDLEAAFGKSAEPIRRELADTEGRPKNLPALLRLGALLHDVAKPACAKMLDGRLRFFEHEAEGARMAGKIMDRLRCSRDEAGWVSAWIVYHLRPGNLASNRIVSDKAVFRFFRDLGPKGVGLLLLCWADHASYLTPARLASVLRWTREDPQTFDSRKVRDADTRKTLYHLQVVSLLLDRWFHRPETARPVRLLDGVAVMKTLGIPPGPKVGELLAALQEAQGEGKVRTREDALRYLRSL